MNKKILAIIGIFLFGAVASSVFLPAQAQAQTQTEDLASGNLFVDRTTVKTGENITLTVTGQDDNGLHEVWAYYQRYWHKRHVNGTHGTQTFIFSESKPGTYKYYGYVYGRKLNGSTDAVYTAPQYVTVTVTQATGSGGGGSSQQQNDPVSGTLSVDKTTAKTGENITLTVKGQDNQGVSKVMAWYQGKWHAKSCSGTSCTKTFIFQESTPGTKYYYGYTYGYKPDQSSEGAYTKPVKVKVNIKSASILKPDLIITGMNLTPASPKVGGKLYGHITVKNIGSKIASNIKVSLKDQKDWGNYGTVNSLSPGNSSVLVIPLTIKSVHATYNPHSFVARADYTNEIDEISEVNNTATRSISIASQPIQHEDPVSGTLSVDKTTANVGENITLTVTGQDDNGLSKLWGYYQNNWHPVSVNGTSFKKAWTFSESKPGTYTYMGYINGKKANGALESSYAKPRSVSVIVKAQQTCTDSDGGKYYYVKGTTIVTENGILVSGKKATDYCTNQNELMEFVCEGNDAIGITYTCPYGCQNGACLKKQEKPDIIVSSVISQPISPTTNDKIDFKATIKNIGSKTMPYVSGGIITKIFSDSLPDPGWRVCDAMTKQLAAGQTTTVDCPIFQTLPAGSHKFTFSTDNGNRLSESNENNNAKQVYLSVASAVQVHEDPVSGTLSVNKTQVKVGEDIQLTVNAQDDNGLTKLWAYYHNSWHYKYADGTSSNNTWTFSESKPGTYVYRGYVYGTTASDLRETTYTQPRSLTVTVTEKEDCKYLYWFDKEHSVCGNKQFCGEYMYYGLQTFVTKDGCEEALSQVKKPDIIVSSVISQPISPTTNDKIDFKATIKNIGSKTMPYVSGGIITKIFSDSLPDPGWRVCDAMTKQLAAGQTTTVDCPIFQTLPAGSHKFTFSTDNGNRLSESNENNNAKQVYLSVASAVQVHEDPVSGTLSVDKTTANVGEDITLTVTGQDDQGVSKMMAYYQGSWHTQYCNGSPSSCTKTWTFSEPTAGAKHYYGYIYGKKLNGTTEGSYTTPSSVSVAVSSSSVATSTTCTDTDGGLNYYTKGYANPSSSQIDGRVDCCKSSYSTYMGDSVNHVGPGGGACVTSGPYLYESICGSDGNPTTAVYKCPNGCQNGVCISTSGAIEKQKQASSMLASIQAMIDNLLKQLQELKK